jgi:hypothetical protein
MAIFPRCDRCGCKLAVAGIAVVCTCAVLHRQELCLDVGKDRALPAMYCNSFLSEPLHLPHSDHQRPSSPYHTMLTASTSSTASNTGTLLGGALPITLR